MPKAHIKNPEQLLKENNELQSFLNDRRTSCNNKASFTHTSIDAPKGSYNIPEDELNIFWDLYYKIVFQDKIHCHLTEKISDKEITPFKIDMDFRYYLSKDPSNTNEKDLDRVYTSEQVDQICMMYMNYIEEWIVSPDDDEREFFIMEKTHPTYQINGRNGKYKKNPENDNEFTIKDGIHIVVPKITSCPFIQHSVRESVFKNVGTILDKCNFINSYSDIFDRSVIDTNNWQMYGSRKNGKEAYKVTRIIKVYKDHVEEIPPETYTDKQLIKILSMRNCDPDMYSMLEPAKEDLVRKNNEDYLTHKNGRRTISNKLKDKDKKKLKEADINLVSRYVDCLSIERSKSYGTWIEVGWCLHNLHNKDDTLLKKWIEFSKRSATHQDEAEDSCREYWENMCNEGLGIASLKLWAKQDNPTEYSQIIKDDIYTHIMHACKFKKGSSNDVAKVIYNMYKDYFVCVSVKDTIWYYYDDTRNCWRMDDKGIMLKSKISDEVYNEFNRIAVEKLQNSHDSGDENGEMAMKIMTVMQRLKDTNFKSNIMTELVEFFYDKEKIFLDNLDQNNYLIGFTNGVYDLKKEQLRKGRPEDFVSLSTNIEYIEYDPDSDEIKDINKMLETIFIIKDVREYVLTRLSSFLSGSTKDETFDIFSGGGGNGKSKVMELLEKSIGDYGCKLPITLLTAKRAASNAATPELAATKGKRIATLQEPDTNTKLNVGLMKELTGGDTIQARALYREPFEFKPQFKMVLCCNDKPELPEHDQGTWRRVRNTDFITAFRFEPEEEKVLQFKIDDKLSEKMDNWAEPFMSLLIHYNKLWKMGYSRVPPDEILEYTREYRQAGNHFRDFANEYLDEDENSKLTLPAAYDAYRTWYNSNHADKNIKSRKEFQAFMDEKFKIKNSGSKSREYLGIKISNKNESTNDSYETFLPDQDDLDL